MILPQRKQGIRFVLCNTSARRLFSVTMLSLFVFARTTAFAQDAFRIAGQDTQSAWGFAVPISTPVAAEVALREIDTLLDQKQFATALKKIEVASPAVRAMPALWVRSAQAYLGTGEVLGKTRVRKVSQGKSGQIDGNWAVLESRGGDDQFLCAPAASAIYQVQKAINSGLDDCTTQLLLARIWLKANRPEQAWRVLDTHHLELLESPTPLVLTVFSEAALARGELDLFVHFAVQQADLVPSESENIRFGAYLAAAERFSHRGDAGRYRAFLRKAVEIRGERSDLLLKLADSLWESDEKEQARLYYRRLLEAEPTTAARSRVLARLSE